MHTVQLKMIIARISGRTASSGISDVAVYSEKTQLKMMMKKKMIIILIIMNKLQETMVIRGGQKLTFAMKLRPEK